MYSVFDVLGVPLQPSCVVSHAFHVAKGAMRGSSFGAVEISSSGRARGLPTATLGMSREVKRRDRDPILENMIDYVENNEHSKWEFRANECKMELL